MSVRLWRAFEGNLLLFAAWFNGLSRPPAPLCDRVSLVNCTRLSHFASESILSLRQNFQRELAAAKLARRHFDFSVVRGGRRPLF